VPGDVSAPPGTVAWPFGCRRRAKASPSAAPSLQIPSTLSALNRERSETHDFTRAGKRRHGLESLHIVLVRASARCESVLVLYAIYVRESIVCRQGATIKLPASGCSADRATHLSPHAGHIALEPVRCAHLATAWSQLANRGTPFLNHWRSSQGRVPRPLSNPRLV